MNRPSQLCTLACASMLTVAACGVSNVPSAPDSSGSMAARHLREFEVHDRPGADPGGSEAHQAIQYARTYLQSLGLQTSVQEVPLVRMSPTATAAQVRGPNGEVANYASPSDSFVMWSARQAERVSVEADVVFAGYGIVSPEYHRDDYKDLDVTGKAVIVLEGSPQTGSRNDLGVLGETYYGTRYYKFAEAARQGAVAILIVHAGDASPWADIRAAATGPTIDIDAQAMAGAARPRAQIEGWLSRDAADMMFGLVGFDYATLHQHARELAFHPVMLAGVRVTLDMTSEVERFTSHDVLAYQPGQTDEYVMLAGRWNRVDPAAWVHSLASTRALDDDGTGAVMVLEAARRLVADGHRPLRGIVFMVATALKPGVVGLEYYLEHPPDTMPVDKMSALIFMDRGDLSGTSQRVGKIGAGSDAALSQITTTAALEQGRLVELDKNPERRFYYGLGQTELARDGTRSIYLTTRPEEDGTGRLLRHVAGRDELVGLDNAVTAADVVPHPSRDAALLVSITLRVANASNWPPRHEPWQPWR